MSESNTEEETEHLSGNHGPGDLLQAGRIEMGLSLEDVASRMHLNSDIVEAIEDNNFSDITAPIFVKGYLRVYARIVSLDEDEMIRRYAEYYSYEDPPISAISNVTPEISTSDKRVRVITFLVIIGLVLLLASWGWNKYQTQPDVVSLDAQPASETKAVEIAAQAVETETEVSLTASGDSQPLVAISEPATVVAEPLPDADQASVDANAPIVEPESLPESAPEAMPEPASGAGSEDVAVKIGDELPESINTEQPQLNIEEEQLQEIEDPSPVGLSDPITRISAAGTDELKIVVNADSWAEVHEATGNRLLFQLVRANEEFNLTGKAPFKVFFGNGYGVEVTFNGEAVDVIGRVKSNNTVKMELGD
jgi:cytoskeleton protein RodZ